jgi:hypothetical protein
MPTYLLHLWRFFSQRVLKLGTDNFRIVLMFFSSVPESHALIARWKAGDRPSKSELSE